jgi:hypothetical protein
MRGKKNSTKAGERLLLPAEARLPRACVSMLAGEMPKAALIARRRQPVRKSKLRRAEGEYKALKPPQISALYFAHAEQPGPATVTRLDA